MRWNFMITEFLKDFLHLMTQDFFKLDEMLQESDFFSVTVF